MLADAQIDDFDEKIHYNKSLISIEGGETTIPVSKAIGEIHGQVVLEGESGLGKTMFLRSLAKKSKNLLVFLPAEKCSKGVISAIQQKLHGLFKDQNFLRQLIYAGSMDILIDGLNEVSADTRALISNFAETFLKSNIIIATQPIEWQPPPNVRKIYLLPLGKHQIQEFLLERKGLSYRHLDDEQTDSYGFKKACKEYISEALGHELSLEERRVNQYILSNPMDLTIVAQMLTLGKKPNLFRLHRQQYEMMAKNYARVHFSSSFPLKNFSSIVYNMKVKDEAILPFDDFIEEIMCMERLKMVLHRDVLNSQGNKKRLWYFRHDKIMDFFIVDVFLRENHLTSKHINDSRFRGVYLSKFDATRIRHCLKG